MAPRRNCRCKLRGGLLLLLCKELSAAAAKEVTKAKGA